MSTYIETNCILQKVGSVIGYCTYCVTYYILFMLLLRSYSLLGVGKIPLRFPHYPPLLDFLSKT
jgi:hypothetical protein